MNTQQTFVKIEEILRERADTLSLVKTFLYHAPVPIIMLDRNLNMIL